MGRGQGCRVHDSRGKILQGRGKAFRKQGKGTKKTKAFAKRAKNCIRRSPDLAENTAPPVAQTACGMSLVSNQKEAIAFF